jgi:serine/threonine protein kinase
MPDPTAESVLGRAADEWLERITRGEQPDVEEYAARFPAVASVIREVFPALHALRGADPLTSDRGEVPSAAALGQLGDFRLIREIGRGGMGIVYEAEQLSLDRRVALKVLPLAGVLDERQLQRFRREAQAAAHLHHTNIVPVFAVGCERGVHYYAMQYIEGCPLSTIITELATRRLTTPVPSNAGSSALLPAPLASGWSQALTAAGSSAGEARFAAVAQLGIQAATALQYAHERGVIHRDVKPSNLLLDVHGRLWLTDFGLAHLAGEPGLTFTGSLLGTLRYMSPEQALARHEPVDARSDIYSLGLSLYELLCLRPAFAGTTQQEVLRRIAQEDAPALRAQEATVPRELATIVHKAIAKDARERYTTAQALADDLRRYLENRPILARPPGPAERVMKWARRHRAAVLAGAGTLVLAVVLLSASTVWVALERAEAVRERDDAVIARGTAERNLALARAAVEELLAPGYRDDLQQQALIREELRASTETTPVELTSITQHDVLQRQLAAALVRTGHVNLLLGQVAPAEAAYRRALRISAETPPDSQADTCVDAAACGTHLALLLWSQQRSAEALDAARQAATEFERTHVAAAALDPEACFRRARLLNLLGRVLLSTGGTATAESTGLQALELLRRLRQERPAEPRWQRELARAEINHASLLTLTRRHGEAERAARDALAQQEALVAAYPEEPTYAAELAFTRRWWQDAARGASPAVAPCPQSRLGELAAQATGEIPWYTARLSRGYRDLDQLLFCAGRLEEAQEAARLAWVHQQRVLAEAPADPGSRVALAELLLEEGQMLMLTWRVRDASAAYERAAGMLAELADEYPDEPRYARLLTGARDQQVNLGRMKYVSELVNLGKQSAVGVARAVELARSTDLEQLNALPFTLLVHADYLMLGDDCERAVQVITRATASLPSVPAYYYKSLGCALLGCGRPDEARAAFQQALRASGLDGRESTALRSACPDPWTAAYFLDRVSLAEYTERHASVLWAGHHMGSYAWFYVGWRAELEGRRADAIAAYRQCLTYRAIPHAHYGLHWAEYRLARLTGEALPEPSGDSSATGVAP